jgi:hypothetical protein
MQLFYPSTAPANFTPGSPIKSDTFNQIVSQMNSNMELLKTIMNDEIYPILSSLPGGDRLLTSADRVNEVDSVINGLDGSQMYMLATSTESLPHLFNTDEDRPYTIYEVVDNLMRRVETSIAEVKGIANKTALSSSIYNNLIISGYPVRSSRSLVRTQTATAFWIKLEDDPSVFSQYNYSGNPYGLGASTYLATREKFRVVYDNGISGASNVHSEFQNKVFYYVGGEWVTKLGDTGDTDYVAASSSGVPTWTTILGTENLKIMRSL